MLEKIEENALKPVEELKADCGYASEDNYKYEVEAKKIDIYMPDKGFVKERKRCMKEGPAFPSEGFIQSTKTQQKSLIEIAREKIYKPENYEKYKARMYEVEPVFGHLKYNLGYRHFLLRGRKKINDEMISRDTFILNRYFSHSLSKVVLGVRC